MTAPKRIQLRRTKGWRKPEGAIVVARPSKWGNPYRIGDAAEDMDWLRGEWVPARVWDAADAVRRFRESIGTGSTFERDVREQLRGHDLACWCPLDQPCHADVLLKLANGEAS